MHSHDWPDRLVQFYPISPVLKMLMMLISWINFANFDLCFLIFVINRPQWRMLTTFVITFKTYCNFEDFSGKVRSKKVKRRVEKRVKKEKDNSLLCNFYAIMSALVQCDSGDKLNLNNTR